MRVPKTWREIAVGELARVPNRNDVFVVVRQYHEHAEILQITGKSKGFFQSVLHAEYAWPIKIRQVVKELTTKAFFIMVQKMVNDMEEK